MLLDQDQLLVQRGGLSYKVTFEELRESLATPGGGCNPILDLLIDLIEGIDGGAAPDDSIVRTCPIDNGWATSNPTYAFNGGSAHG